MEEFASSRPEGPQRRELIRALQGQGAFRRFKDIVLAGGDVELKDAWLWFETTRLRQRIVEWLEVHGIAPQWDGANKGSQTRGQVIILADHRLLQQTVPTAACPWQPQGEGGA
jgi:hypothetical protein